LDLAMSGAVAPPAATVITGADGYSDGLTGTAGADRILGLSGNDALDGSAGDDVLEGGLGDDLLAGGAGSDLIYGGAGRDMILSATGLNLPGRLGSNGEWAAPASAGAIWTQGRLWGIYASSDANGPTYIIDGGGSLGQDSAGDIVFAGDDDDRVIGGLGDDYIDGGQGNDSLTGHGGNDVIDGGAGRSISAPPEKYIPCQSMYCGAPTTKVVSTAGAPSCTLPKVRRKAGMTRRRRAKGGYRVMTDGGIGTGVGCMRSRPGRRGSTLCVGEG
jgi:hypothetical protein